jgi:hypothetical protein
MNKTFSLFAFLFFTLALIGCKKEQAHYTISQDFMKWVYFKEGSYWIYKNEKKGIIDSCYIASKALFATSNSEKDLGYLFDFIEMHFNSSFLETGYIRSTPTFDYADYYTGDWTIGSIRTNINIGQKVKWGDDVYEELAFYDTFTLNDSVFRNVIHTRIAYPGYSYDSIIRQYYFSKNIGLIKYEKTELNTDSIWSLMRWHVFQ